MFSRRKWTTYVTQAINKIKCNWNYSSLRLTKKRNQHLDGWGCYARTDVSAFLQLNSLLPPIEIPGWLVLRYLCIFLCLIHAIASVIYLKVQSLVTFTKGMSQKLSHITLKWSLRFFSLLVFSSLFQNKVFPSRLQLAGSVMIWNDEQQKRMLVTHSVCAGACRRRSSPGAVPAMGKATGWEANPT